MTHPIAPWSEYARDEWARMGARWADELRPPETDEEPWDVLDAAIVGTAWWAVAVAVVGGALAAVLVVLGIRRAVR
jgi:hypothetical protein